MCDVTKANQVQKEEDAVLKQGIEELENFKLYKDLMGKALLESEERFNLAVKAAREGVWDWNMETDAVWYSPRYKEMLGYADDEIEHHVSAWLRLLHPDDKEPSLRIVEAVMRGERDYEIEFRLRHKDGHYLDILSRGFPVRREADGKIVRIVGIHFDLSERKEAEERVLRQNAILRAINRIFHRALTCETEEELGKVCLSVAEELTQSKFGFIGEVGLDGMLHCIAISNPGWDACTMTDNGGQRRLPGPLKPQGLWGRILLNGKTLLTNDPSSHPDSLGVPEGHPPLTAFLGVPLVENGRTIGLMAMGNREDGFTHAQQEALEAIAAAIVRALSEKRAHRAALEAKAKLEAALDSMTDAVFLSDAQGRYVDFNDAYATFHRFKNKDECPRKRDAYPHILDVFMDDGTWAPLDMWAIPRALRGEKAANVDYTIRRKDTGESWIGSYSFGPIRGKDGAMIGAVVVARDVTAQRKLQDDLNRITLEQRAILDTANVAISLVRDRKQVWINSKIEEMFQYPREELVNQTTRKLYTSGEAYERMGTEAYPVLAQGLPYETVQEHVRRDGTHIWVKYNGRAIDPPDLSVGILWVLEDITERKQAEDSLRQSEERFRALTTAGNDVVYRMSADWRVLLHLVGRDFIPDTESPSAVWLETYIPPDDRAHMTAAIQEAIRTKNAFRLEHRVIRVDGGLGWTLSRAIPLLDDKGEIREWIGAAIDITRQKQAEITLGETEAKYHALVENANEAILVAQDGKFAYANTKTGTLLGVPVDDLIGTSFINYIHPDDREVVLERYKKRIAGESIPDAYEFRIVTREGESRWLHLRAQQVQWDGNPATLNMLTDVTEKKQAEEEKIKLQHQLLQAQKMESIGRLAGGVAHDFNNMLGVILGHTEMAMDQVEHDDPLWAGLEEIRKAAERSADLTHQLLAFARKQTVSPKLLDLNETVEGMLKMLRRLIGEDIDLLWKPGHRLRQIHMDPSQIDQVLANLCVNARDAISGVGKVTIETANVLIDDAYGRDHLEAVSGEYVMLAISDDGSGMDKETLGKLFEPFYTTKEVGKGTGLGLATVYGIMKQNNGFINVYSEPHQGTTFKLYFPRYMGNAEPVKKEKKDESTLSGHETVLIVEDEPAILDLGKRMLEKLGYHVLAAKTPKQAISVAEGYDGPVQLLITDVVMPEMNGRDLAGRLLSFYPNLKCLFMSGYTANVIAHHGILDKEVHFIQKPFSIKDLATKTREALDNA